MTEENRREPATAGGIGRFAPGLAALLHYQPSWLRSDLAAGLSVAAVALPVGIAYSDLAGVPPVIGMYAAIFPLFAYALFGSSRQLMTGPDAATCIMVAAILAPLAGGDPERYQGLMVLLTLTTGLIYVVAGSARLGFISNFLSLPILTGFLNGIALIIVVGQLPKLFGYAAEADAFGPKILEFFDQLGTAHGPTLLLGLSMLVLLVLLRRWVPRLPSALVIVVLGIVLVQWLGLADRGVAVLGAIPAGLPPAPTMPSINFGEAQTLLRDAAGLMLVSFTSGILTAKSFAQRSGYEVNANQELVAFGACNIASGIAQGFPVTGADSRTAINNAMGGKSQMVGVVAGGAMLLILFFLTKPLALVPSTALAAVIIVSAAGLFDLDTLRALYTASRVELAFSVGTTLGVLILGVLPGVLLAVVLSLVMLLAVTSRPADAVLGRISGMRGFHNVAHFPDAKTAPGLLLYRFEANIVFYNVDYFKERLLAAIEAAADPVEWVVIDLSSVNVIDATSVKKFDDLKQQLEDMGILLAVSHQRRTLGRFFEERWVDSRRELMEGYSFPTLKAAVHAFKNRDRTA